MSAVEIPAELVERTVTFVRVVQDMGELNWPGETERVTARLLVDELRALLPKPAPTCPNCGHDDDEHLGQQCRSRDEDDALCGCPFPRRVLDDLRRVIAAELEAAQHAEIQAPAEPRVWQAGDPEPDGVIHVEDRDGDIWTRRTDGSWSSPETREFLWEHIARKWAPLTEVPTGGAR